MPRNKRLRKIVAPPRFSGYKPYGCRPQSSMPVELFFEEYEALKLADYKMLNHEQAAILMDVSRATFARIYENARRKIALALVETREIVTSTGSSYTEKRWKLCTNCHARFNNTAKNAANTCPLCSSEKTEYI
ncbi:MAG TPA: DUF134 domain-containing protein [Prolixibacteraceae bacterium]|nr:DUF134 domain-containing protein [Prolixibacteraceae bacterium]HPR59927.1 DUF134 domain-containing protein [Prolixibacteraceae bacterium]